MAGRSGGFSVHAGHRRPPPRAPAIGPGPDLGAPALVRRVVPLLLSTGLLVGACGAGPDPSTSRSTDDGVGSVVATGREDAELAAGVPQIPGGPREEVVSALHEPADPRLPPPLIDTRDLVSGGPPPDGIPSIDEPTFLTPADAGFLEDREPVVALRIGDDARAYPVQIMTWHEIVNDTVGGVPVAVSYCPLCNSAVAYDRRSGERVLDFGTSGLLFQSALVMYDRQTESLWSHFTGQAVVGELVGTDLELFPLTTVSWADWRDANPDGLVLSRDTGHERAYGQNPYPGYDDIDTSPFLFEGEVDGRLAAKTRMVGLRSELDAVAVVLDDLLERRVVDVDFDGRRLVVWARPGTASALDATSVAGGRDVGATGAFLPRVGDRELTFRAAGDGFEDLETASRWNVLGEAEDGPLAGEVLEPVEHVDTFWFAWAAFLPDTRLAP
jgi:hypothetical protein